MKKALFLIILGVLSHFLLAQQHQILTKTNGYISHSLATDTSLLLVCEDNQIKIWDIETNKLLDSIQTNSVVKSAGFIGPQRIGVIYDNSGQDQLYAFDLFNKHRAKKLPFPVLNAYFDYSILYDKDYFYITVSSQALTWKYRRSNNILISVEKNAIYTNENGLIIKHLYKPNITYSYGFENVLTGNKYTAQTFSEIKSFNTQSFSLDGKQLIIADAEQIPTIRIYDLSNTKLIRNIVSKRQAIVLVSFLASDNIMIVESSIDLSNMNKKNYLTLTNVGNNKNITTELTSGNLNNVVVSFKRKHVIYHESDLIHILTIK